MKELVMLRPIKKKNQDITRVEVIETDDRYKIYANENYIFECAINDTLLETLIKAYIKLLES